MTNLNHSVSLLDVNEEQANFLKNNGYTLTKIKNPDLFNHYAEITIVSWEDCLINNMSNEEVEQCSIEFNRSNKQVKFLFNLCESYNVYIALEHKLKELNTYFVPTNKEQINKILNTI